MLLDPRPCRIITTYDDFRGQFFRIFEVIMICFVVAICDLVHAVKAMYGLP